LQTFGVPTGYVVGAEGLGMEPERPSKSAAEIATLPPMGSTECAQFLRGAGPSLEPETLVYVIREATGIRNTELIQLASMHLVGTGDLGPPGTTRTHAERVILSVARRFGFNRDPAVLDEFFRACFDGMWDAILAGRSRKPFWEASFRNALYSKCIDIGRPVYHRWRKDVPIETLPPLSGPDVLGQTLALMGEETILEAIRKLPPSEAQASMLHWVEARPVDSPDPGSVKNLMGLSARQVHNLLANARRRLAQDPAVRALREAS